MVDALSWLQTGTGAVSYKNVCVGPTFFFFKSLMAVVGEEQGFLESFTGLKPAIALYILYIIEKQSVQCPRGSVSGFRMATAFAVYLARLFK